MESLRVQPMESLRGQARAWLSGPFRPRLPLPKHAMESLLGQALAWLSGPFRPQWPLPKHALE